ncbi:MAG: sulfurtransferase [Cytophagales bacterium]|nr:sulfurtransferase [Rhizobacter sp.]
MHPLISAHDLLARSPQPVLLDCSFDLADPAAGERSYRERHLPGARYVHLDRDLSAPKNGHNGRHPLREPEDYARWMGETGIAPGTSIVVYDRQGGTFAVRAWWVLRWMGHANVALLDGGLAAWQQAGGALSTDLPTPHPTTAYPWEHPALPTLHAQQLQSRLADVLVIDARAPERYRGEVEPLDAVAGHIPGAVNRFFKDNLQADGRFKPAEQLRAEFGALLDGRPVVHQCGSGVTACHNLLAMELAGLEAGALYPGSWSEWSSDASRPMSARRH